jgi:hypothetical protein
LSAEEDHPELTIDESTGSLDLETSFDRKTEYSLSIIITNTGGNEEIVSTIPDI